MSNDTTFQICIACGEEKPHSEFYTRLNPRSTALQKTCKACWTTQINSTAKKNNRSTLIHFRSLSRSDTENAVITKLRTHGIWATSGKASGFKYVDVVAWGAVRIEVKSASLNAAECFDFRFSAKQVRAGVNADFIVLICMDGGSGTFHVFPANHPAFYNSKGLISRVRYNPDRKAGFEREHILTLEMLLEYQDAWHLIEEKRLEISEHLKLAK